MQIEWESCDGFFTTNADVAKIIMAATFVSYDLHELLVFRDSVETERTCSVLDIFYEELCKFIFKVKLKIMPFFSYPVFSVKILKIKFTDFFWLETRRPSYADFFVCGDVNLYTTVDSL